VVFFFDVMVSWCFVVVVFFFRVWCFVVVFFFFHVWLVVFVVLLWFVFIRDVGIVPTANLIYYFRTFWSSNREVRG